MKFYDKNTGGGDVTSEKNKLDAIATVYSIK